MTNNNDSITLKDRSHYIMTLLERVTDCCDFLTLFSSILYINNETYFNLDNLINFIDECKQNSKYSNLLNNIYIKNDPYNSFNKAIKIMRIDKDIKEFLYKSDNEEPYRRIIIINKNLNLKDAFSKSSDRIAEMNSFIEKYYEYPNKHMQVKSRNHHKVKVRKSRTKAYKK